MHGRPEASKVSRYETALQVQSQIGRPPMELQLAPDLPVESECLWGAFSRLSDVSYTEIKAYAELTGNDLDCWEIDTIIGLGKIRLNPPSKYEWQEK